MTRQKTKMARRSSPDRLNSGDLLGPNSEIGRKLKKYYDQITAEEVPDRFTKLLAQLEAAEGSAEKE